MKLFNLLDARPRVSSNTAHIERSSGASGFLDLMAKRVAIYGQVSAEQLGECGVAKVERHRGAASGYLVYIDRPPRKAKRND